MLSGTVGTGGSAGWSPAFGFTAGTLGNVGVGGFPAGGVGTLGRAVPAGVTGTLPLVSSVVSEISGIGGRLMIGGCGIVAPLLVVTPLPPFGAAGLSLSVLFGTTNGGGSVSTGAGPGVWNAGGTGNVNGGRTAHFQFCRRLDSAAAATDLRAPGTRRQHSRVGGALNPPRGGQPCFESTPAAVR